ncbi:3-oxo-tetronate kinase [Faunimonas sp. B44]|uniref:3-oxo-tetronate kinase n=1 Tax=Faunimonas sp. B44 TaxID=3461493 RepID=UPI0040442A45
MSGRAGPFLGAIADDLTGATDLALTLSNGGMRVRQIVGIPRDPDSMADAEAVVLSLKSRTIPAGAAVAQSVQALDALLAAGTRQIFFKYCSTFDSTDDGNIGPVIEALLDRLGESRTFACPAFPANGRTVYQGHLFVGDRLLSDSSMKDHPLTPMRDANLVRVLGRQTRLPVSLVDLATVRSGPDALRGALETATGVAIVDAIDDDDLRAIGAAARDFRLVTGGSGVALGLPGNFHLRHAKIVSGALPRGGRAIVLAGSCSAATRRQIAVATAAGTSGYKLDPRAIARGAQTPADALAFVLAAPHGDIPIVYASAAPEEVAASQAALGRERAGGLVESFMGELAARAAEAGVRRLLVAGGETSGAVIESLGLDTLDVVAEIDPGVPWMAARYRGAPLAIALKSGNFGADDIFLKAWDRLA